ncbi:MAG TPA: PhzF family phenazine biosynthesis isomerase [Gemmatimonadaceae bacterium]
MQRIASEVGISESAFVAPAAGARRTVRYYSPEAELSFCGHATIATGVVLGETDGHGNNHLATAVGDVPVEVRTREGRREASLTSVAPRHEPAPDALVREALEALGWDAADLDPTIPPARAYAGAWHLVLVTRTAERLRDLHYDFAALRALMPRDGSTTLQLVWREGDHALESRNPFPVENEATPTVSNLLLAHQWPATFVFGSCRADAVRDRSARRNPHSDRNGIASSEANAHVRCVEAESIDCGRRQLFSPSTHSGAAPTRNRAPRTSAPTIELT